MMGRSLFRNDFTRNAMPLAMNRLRLLVPLALLQLGIAGLITLPAGSAAEKGDDPKEALQELQDFIGKWKGQASGKVDSPKETASWGWRFKGKDVSLTVEMPESKVYKSGEMRFLSDKGKYQLTLVDRHDKKQVYVGNVNKKTKALELERKVPDTGDTEQVKINSAGGGVRLVQAVWLKPAGRTIFSKQYELAYTKEGESFGVAAGQKGPECVVTGGLGTMQVSYMGATYYVCCTGCRDAFNENPAKIIAEYKARKAAGK
jgi:hypothetical protein